MTITLEVADLHDYGVLCRAWAKSRDDFATEFVLQHAAFYTEHGKNPGDEVKRLKREFTEKYEKAVAEWAAKHPFPKLLPTL